MENLCSSVELPEYLEAKKTGVYGTIRASWVLYSVVCNGRYASSISMTLACSPGPVKSTSAISDRCSPDYAPPSSACSCQSTFFSVPKVSSSATLCATRECTLLLPRSPRLCLALSRNQRLMSRRILGFLWVLL